jgi:holliday junction DNA helicase RuvA
MIVSLQGTLVAATPLAAVIETNGIGYEVHVPVTTAERLPHVGQAVKLHTIAIYREDSQALYGFATAEDRDFFRLLIEHVSGVGPKMALTIMSRLSLGVLRAAIADGDVGLLSKCHGIGRKTAERLVVELKDKLGAGTIVSPQATGTVSLGAVAGAPASSADGRMRDAVAALIALGYKLADAEKAVRRVAGAVGPEATTEQLIKRALASG